ncbi:MAG: carbohydrate ABC transporter permease [Clostridia bacterium]|nr:carbohydrate ABC transporter permease [Clostridia bacterium]
MSNTNNQAPVILNQPKKIKLDMSDRIIRGFTYVLVTLFSIACIIPFWMVIASSFSSEEAIRRTGFTLWPSDFSLFSYELLFRSPDQMIGAYVVTIGLAVVGTLIGLFVISMTGYALQRKDFPFRNHIMFYIYFTSLFSAGLVPFYLLIKQTLNLADTYWAILLPLLMSPWLIVLMKNFVKAIPHEITESGKIDGAGDFRIFWNLILPSMKPALATIGLFLALAYWNEWYYSSLFLSSKVPYRPLQYHLYNVINKVASLKNSIAGSKVVVEDLPGETLKMATATIATGPIILLYPFVQKYFVAGLTVGSVKG